MTKPKAVTTKAWAALRGLACRRPLVLGVVALAVLAAAYLALRGLGRSGPAELVRVRRGRITANVETSGQVKAAREAWLSLRTGSVIKSVLAKPGQQVGRGDVLLQADTTDLERQVREAEINLQIRQIQYDDLKSSPSTAQIEIARANLRRAAAVLQAAQSNYDRVAAQGKASGSNEAAALEAAKLDYEQTRAGFDQTIRGPSPEQIKVAEKGLELARLSLQNAQNQLQLGQISAPFVGTVLQITAREGEHAYGEKVIRLADLSTLEVVVQVDELDIGELVLGQEAVIRFDALPGQVLSGRVARITPGATPQRGTVGYEVGITFSPGQVAVRPDMSANVRIVTLTHDDTLLVPIRAVETRGRNKYVRVQEGGRVRDVRVTTGLSDGNDTEIVEGLKEGQQVLVR